jgi:hypothetical protein
MMMSTRISPGKKSPGEAGSQEELLQTLRARGLNVDVQQIDDACAVLSEHGLIDRAPPR